MTSELDTLRTKLHQWEYAVEHVTEDPSKHRSVSGGKWTLISTEHYMDLLQEIQQLRDTNKHETTTLREMVGRSSDRYLHMYAQLTNARAEIDRLWHQLAEDYLASKAEIERLMAVVADRNCDINELQDTMEWQRDKLAECRRLLREACGYIDMGAFDSLRHGWLEAAKAAGGK